jgi:hypothetical protein
MDPDHTRTRVVDPVERATRAAELRDGAELLAVPLNLRGGLDRYILDGILPGGFLQAVLCCDLREAALRADPVSLFALPTLVHFLEHYAPRECWGSHAAVVAYTVTPDRLEIPPSPKWKADDVWRR